MSPHLGNNNSVLVMEDANDQNPRSRALRAYCGREERQ